MKLKAQSDQSYTESQMNIKFHSQWDGQKQKPWLIGNTTSNIYVNKYRHSAS